MGEFWLYTAESHDQVVLKVGYTGDPERRRLALRSRKYGLRPTCWWPLGRRTRSSAFAIEAAVHRALEAKWERLRGEYFSVTSDDALSTIDDTLAALVPELGE